MSNEFRGYVRPSGRVGVRNHLLILSVTGLTGPTARRISACLPGSVVIDFPYDGGLLGEDRAAQDRALAGLGSNPNAGAVLLIGANTVRVGKFTELFSVAGTPVTAITLDECGHDAVTLTERGIRAGALLSKVISGLRREPVSLLNLTLGLECGRSDPSSGLVSNPLLGLIADRVVDSGGVAMIGESVEWMGAEHLLAARAATPDVAQKIQAAVDGREGLAVAGGIDLTGNNPGPSNIAGGLSTIEEKSLGNIAKSGSRPIQSVVAWAEAPAGPGFHLMDACSYAPESLTGFSGAGAQLLLFTTGVGNSYVNASAPTIKVGANPETSERLNEQLDYACPAVFSGDMALEQAAEELFVVLVDVASGTRTWGEILGEGGESFSRMGASI
ncbi:UxaA family hydrolase [Alphaproteobacteria bacterium]|jgi:altronate dehydratase large subunit|nr:UxaA family hydrolase [Alphaproteobacteria bacterium]